MPAKIDITKKYKCANGAEAKLYAHELLCGAGVTFWGFSGAIRRCGFSGWETTQWMYDGTMPNMPGFSLVEIKPKVRVRGSVIVYRGKPGHDAEHFSHYCSHIYASRQLAETARAGATADCAIIDIDTEVDGH